MTASANGWRVITRGECVTIDIPGGQVPVHPRLAAIFTDLGHRYHERVEPLVWPGCWGWAKPTESGRNPAKFVTNHSSGTAVDLCAPQHPQGVGVNITFTTRELDEIAALEQRYAGVLQWGGRWSGKSVDGMHWEVAPGVTPEQVDALTGDLQRLRPPVPAPLPPTPVPAPPQNVPSKPPAPAGGTGNLPAGWTGPDLTGAAFALRGDEGNNGPRVAGLQDFFRRKYPLYAKAIVVDGWWGPKTTAAVREFAARSGVRTSDGRNIGPLLARKLYLSGFRG